MVLGASNLASSGVAAREAMKPPRFVPSEDPNESNRLASGMKSSKPSLTSGLHIMPLDVTTFTGVTL